MRISHRRAIGLTWAAVSPALFYTALPAAAQTPTCPVERRVECTPLGDRMHALLRAVAAGDTAALRPLLPARGAIRLVGPSESAPDSLSPDSALASLTELRRRPDVRVWGGVRRYVNRRARWKASGLRFEPAVPEPRDAFVEWRAEGDSWVVAALATGSGADPWDLMSIDVWIDARCDESDRSSPCAAVRLVGDLSGAILNRDTLDLRRIFPPGGTVAYTVGGFGGGARWQVSNQMLVRALGGDPGGEALRASFAQRSPGAVYEQCDTVARLYQPTGEWRPDVVALRLREGRWVVSDLGAAVITGEGRRAGEALALAARTAPGDVRELPPVRALATIRNRATAGEQVRPVTCPPRPPEGR